MSIEKGCFLTLLWLSFLSGKSVPIRTFCWLLTNTKTEMWQRFSTLALGLNFLLSTSVSKLHMILSIRFHTYTGCFLKKLHTTFEIWLPYQNKKKSVWKWAFNLEKKKIRNWKFNKDSEHLLGSCCSKFSSYQLSVQLCFRCKATGCFWVNLPKFEIWFAYKNKKKKKLHRHVRLEMTLFEDRALKIMLE